MFPETGQLSSLLSSVARPEFETNSGAITQPLIIAGTWIAEGPASIQHGQAHAAPNNLVAGATKAVAVNPANPAVIYVGTVNDGIWKTINGTASSPSWLLQTDAQASLSIGALKLDPTDATHNTLIAGIGDYSSLNSIGGPRTGFLRTTNGGTNWSIIIAVERPDRNGRATVLRWDSDSGKELGGIALEPEFSVANLRAISGFC